uniref:PHD-type domain-containing protein n=1 Tax=Caenorhabditis tropicalis TaxID=1561998 RepID=A0A1I7TG76_9PELO
MIIPQREKINPNKKHRGQDDWCICNGANTNSDMMVECENKDCPQEWFHFDCVGLTEPPENEWYCPNCSSLPDQSFSTLWHN